MPRATERQLTFAPHGHILTNTGVFSPDGEWIVFDTRSDAEGALFDGTRIQAVHVKTGEVRTLYESTNGAHCGVATWHTKEHRVVFILGPEHPTADYAYAPHRRQGVLVDFDRPGVATNLDARDLVPPYTAGALRGGTHVHVFSPDGRRVSFTYDDEVLTHLGTNQRNVGVAIPGKVGVRRAHPRNHDGSYFSVLVTRTTSTPRPGSDDITRAFEDAWLGNDAIAFQGTVTTAGGQVVNEVFKVSLADDLTRPGREPLEGTPTTQPAPPAGVTQTRLTHTVDRRYPGIQGPRHWLRSAPDGSRIACLMQDDAGVVQLFAVSPAGEVRQVTRNATSISSAFTWSPDGWYIAHTMDRSLCVTDAATGETARLTPRSAGAEAPRPEAVVFAPGGGAIAYVRRVEGGEGTYNQVFVATLHE